MDPEAKRFVWKLIEKISKRGKKSAVIMTTHTMDEAELLSSKLGIMVEGGVMRCMGSAQHIKDKFSYSYEIQIRLNKPQAQELQDLALEYDFDGDMLSMISLNDAVEQL